VDRSAAYAAPLGSQERGGRRLADRCEIQVAYAIGVAHPLSVNVETFGTGKIADEKISALNPGALRPAPGVPSSATWTCAAPSTARPPPTATSAGTMSSSPGKTRTKPRPCAKPPDYKGQAPQSELTP